MQTVKDNSGYVITTRGVVMVENALENPSLIQISVISGCTITLPPMEQYGISLVDDMDPYWNLTGVNTRLNKAQEHTIYARLNRGDRNALLVFSVNDYNIDGSITETGEDGESVQTKEPSTLYYYIKVGRITSTDSVSSPTVEREITFDFGYYKTDRWSREDSMWLPKEVWDRNIEERNDEKGSEYLLIRKPIVVKGGGIFYSDKDPSIPSFFEGIPIDTNTLQWVDGKLTVVSGSGGASNWDELKGKPSWITDTKPTYAWGEITQKPTTLSGYGIQASDVLNTIKSVDGSGSGLDADTLDGKHYIDIINGNVASATKLQTARTIWGQSFDGTANVSGSLTSVTDITGTGTFTGANIKATDSVYVNGIRLHKTVDGAVTIEGNLLVTGGITAYADGEDSDGTGGGVIVIDNLTSTLTDAALSANQGRVLKDLIDSKVSNWGELEGKPTTISGYGITDAYTKTECDDRYFRYIGNTDVDGEETYWQKLGMKVYSNAYPDNLIHKIYSYGVVATFGTGRSTFELYVNHISSDTNQTTNGMQYRSGYSADKKSWRMLLDEVNCAYYLNTIFDLCKVYFIDLSSYSSSNFYPVIFDQAYRELNCCIQSPSAGGSAAYNCNRIHFLYSTNGWSDFGNSLTMLSRHNYQDGEITIGSIGRGTKSGGCIAVWLRGGLSYAFICNRTPNLKTSNYTISEETYTVGTGISGGTNSNVEIIWTNDSNRTKYDLATISSNVASASKLTTDAGSATRPVYFANGIPIAGTYTFGNANGNAAINNGALNVNLNSDLLDGYHINNIQTGGWINLTSYSYDETNGMRYYWYKIATIGNSTGLWQIEVDARGDANYTGGLRCIISFSVYNSGASKSVSIVSQSTTYDNKIEVCMDTQGNVYMRAYNVTWTCYFKYRITHGDFGVISNSPANILLPGSQKPDNTSNVISIGGIKLNNGSFLYTDTSNIFGNSSSTTRLQTSRNLWGQSFDGTKDVTGSMTVNGNITIANGSSSTLTLWDSSAYLQQQNISDLGGYGLYLYGSAGTRIANSLVVDSKVLAKGGFETSNSSILRFTPYTNKNVINWSWDNTWKDCITFSIPGTNNQTIYMKLSSSSGLNLWGTFTANGNILATGGITCYSSDQRAKTIVEQINLSLKQIANAPTIRFKWNNWKIRDDGKTHIGGIAQYVQGLLPETILEANEMLNMDYATTGYIFSVLTARHLLSYETRTDRIIRKLKERIKRLERQLNIENHEEVCIVAD